MSRGLGDVYKRQKYDNVRLGMNSRLDTLQAAILIPKLRAFREYELEAVNQAAERYTELLSDIEGLRLPVMPDGYYSSWAQYTVQIPDGTDRDAVQRRMKEAGIPTMVYYKKPMHRQGAFYGTRSGEADCPVTEDICDKVLCLPIHPYLEAGEIEVVAQELRKALW